MLVDIHNHSDRFHDVTNVTDLEHGMRLLMNAVPERPESVGDLSEGDCLSPLAMNVGKFGKVRLLDFVDAIESELCFEASLFLGRQRLV